MRDKIVRKGNTSEMASMEQILWSGTEQPMLSSQFGYKVYKVNGSQVVLYRRDWSHDIEYLGTVREGNELSGAIDIILKHLLGLLSNPNLHNLMEDWTDSKPTYRKIMLEAGLQTRVAIEFVNEYTDGGN